MSLYNDQCAPYEIDELVDFHSFALLASHEKSIKHDIYYIETRIASRGLLVKNTFEEDRFETRRDDFLLLFDVVVRRRWFHFFLSVLNKRPSSILYRVYTFVIVSTAKLCIIFVCSFKERSTSAGKFFPEREFQ